MPSRALELVEDLVAPSDVMNPAADGLEVPSQELSIERSRPREDAHVGPRAIAHLAEVPSRDRLDIQKSAAHRGHVGDRRLAGGRFEVGEDALAHDEIVLPSAAPRSDVRCSWPYVAQA